MREVRWADSAIEDYSDVLRYVASEDPDAAGRIVLAIKTCGAALAEFATGHPGRVDGIYEKSVPRLPYIIAYAVADDTITILHVIHAARDWPEGRWPG